MERHGFTIGSIVGFFLYTASFIIVGGMVAGALLYAAGTPVVDDLLTRHFSGTTILYDRSGNHVLYELHGEENRKMVPYEEMSTSVRLATLSAEDTSFYDHHGIDFTAIARALKVNIERDDVVQGGSTITQQLARSVFLDRQKTVRRKVLEALLAVKIERKFSKNEILSLYLNSVPYGSNAYGIEAAAETFFKKDAKDLTLDESALLAALPKAPTYYSPYGEHVRELESRKQAIIVKLMRLGWVSNEEGESALSANTLSKISPDTHPIQAPHFVFYVLEQLEKEYGGGFLESAGWKVYTTLDYDLQMQAEKSVREGASRNVSRGASNAALVALDAKTGEILAMVGSKDYFNEAIDGEVNVTTRPRQPGSAFKPFAYARAFEKGYQPETLLYDVETDFGPDGSGKNYVPRNYDGRFHGLLPMRKTLANSLNVPSVQTLYLAGVQETIDLAHRLGITTLQDRNRYGLSLVLGGGEVKLLDMVSAFSVFAREGVRHVPQGVASIVDSKGNTLQKNQSVPQRVLDIEIARKINSILSDNEARSMIFGSRSPLAFPGNTVAAKTGTTQEFRDAWTVGYSPSVAVGVWAGNNDNRPMHAGADGVFVAAPIWRDFMNYIVNRYPKESFAPYTPVTSDKPMLSGSVEKGEVRYFHTGTGKELSAKEAAEKNPKKVRVQGDAARHSILYYVNKDNPLGSDPPNLDDPMLERWEKSLGVVIKEVANLLKLNESEK